jgi:hypothetical protein
MKAPEQLMPHALHCLKMNKHTDSSPEGSGVNEIMDNWDTMLCSLVDRHHILGHAMAQTAAGLSLQIPQFNPKPVHVGFVVDILVVGTVFLQGPWYSTVSIIPPMLLYHAFTYHQHYTTSAVDSVIN